MTIKRYISAIVAAAVLTLAPVSHAFEVLTGQGGISAVNSGGSTNITGLVVGNGSTLSAYGGGTCTNQVVRVLGASGTPTCVTITSAYVDSSIVKKSGSVTSGNVPVFSGTDGTVVDGPSVLAATDDTVPVGSGSVWENKTVANCPDSGGNHLNYTQSSNSFSCGTSGGGFDVTTTAELFYDEFCDVSGSATNYFVGAGTGTQAIAAAAVAAKPCQAVLTTTTTTDEYSALYLKHTHAVDGDDKFKGRFRWNIGSTAANDVYVGFADYCCDESSVSDGAYIRRRQADTNYFFSTCHSGTCTHTDSGVAADTSDHTFLIQRVDGTHVEFSIDGGSATSVTTNLPTTEMYVTHYIKTKTTAAKTLTLDYSMGEVTGLTR